MAQSRRWCFTLNNYTAEEEQRLHQLGQRVIYLVVGRELSDTGTPHLQGFVIFNTRLRPRSVKSELGNRCHIEVTRGSSPQAATYCKKEGDYFEHGTCPTQGKRTDLEEFIEYCKELSSVPSRKELAQRFPSLYLRFQRLHELAALHAPTIQLVDGDPNPGWQSDLVSRVLNEDAHPREVEFLVDPEGNKGKTWIGSYLLTKNPDSVQILGVGKESDMCFAIDETKHIFIVDVPRSKMEYLQYSVLEMLKNRTVFSSKYESRLKMLSKCPHVVVFCNEDPDISKLSEDRFKITRI
jgi:hypothetical protein